MTRVTLTSEEINALSPEDIVITIVGSSDDVYVFTLQDQLDNEEVWTEEEKSQNIETLIKLWWQKADGWATGNNTEFLIVKDGKIVII